MRKAFLFTLIAFMTIYSTMTLFSLPGHVKAASLQPAIHEVDCASPPSRYVQLTILGVRNICYAKDGNDQEGINLPPVPLTQLRSVGYSGVLIGAQVILFQSGATLNLGYVPFDTLVIDEGSAS